MKRHAVIMVGAVLSLAAVLLTPAITSAAVAAPSNADYTAMPPFLPTVVPPNILLLVDNSGSMDNSAYHQSTSDPLPGAQPTGADVYNVNKAYGGYFDEGKCYTYNSASGGYFVIGVDRPAPGGASTCGSNSQWDGNFLNYITATRIEIVKWVMMGGKCTSRSSGNCYPSGKLVAESTSRDQVGVIIPVAGLIPSSAGTGTKCLFRNGSVVTVRSSTCSGGTDYTLVISIAEEPTGIIQGIGNKARFGLMEFKATGSTEDGGKVISEVGATTASMVTAIENTSSNTWTPLAESLYEATRYFAQLPPAFPGTDYVVGATHDPYNFQPPWASAATYVPCCKSFVIVFTDGQPTHDNSNKVPTGILDYSHAAGNHGNSLHCNLGPGCTGDIVDGNGPQPDRHSQNYPNPSLNDHNNVINEHHDNCSKYYGGALSDPCRYIGSHWLDDVAYYAHTKDLRNGALTDLPTPNVPPAIPGDDHKTVHNLTVYTFFAFGTGSNILKDAAKLGGFEDIPPKPLPAGYTPVPDQVQEWDKVNNYTGAKGADGLPDTYFESASADDLKDKLLATINSILQRSASGTSASVLASSSTGEGALYQAYFFPQVTEGLDTILWPGYVQGLWVDKFGNLREDTVADQKLIYEDDYIIKMVYDKNNGVVNVERYKDGDGDGKADLTDTNSDGKGDTAVPISPNITLSSITPIWEAGKQLALKDPNSRIIYTWIDKDADGVVDSDEYIPFTSANATLLRPYLSSATVSTSTDVFNATNLVKWIRGENIADSSGNLLMRDRQLSIPGVVGKKIWKLGDPVNSSPTVVSAPTERYDVIYGDPSYQKFYQAYRNRRQVIYVGANDGMMHAFNGGFYTRGDDTSSSSTKKEHGFFTTQRTVNPVTNTPPLGDELWAFVPQELLPHLRWLAMENYSHVYYVDLKPRVTEVRVFCDAGSSAPPSPCINGQPGVSHPDGWGTILIGGFRFGGSCGAANCKAANSAVKTMKVTGDFNYDGDTSDATDTREFYSAYFVLDVTDPEAAAVNGPKLLWSFTDQNLGFTTSYPAVARVKPPCSSPNCKVDATDAKWFILFGSGPTNYKVDTIQQGSRVYAFELAAIPTKTIFDVSGSLQTPPATPVWQALIGDMITVDKDLDYRVDMAYAGSLINDGAAPWRGEMYRLPTPCASAGCLATSWGFSNGSGRSPSKVLSTFGSPSTEIGPIVGAPTMSLDDGNNMWVFFGTGRFYDSADKTLSEQQYFVGVKDRVHAGCVDAGSATCASWDLVNVTGAQVFTDNSIQGISSGGVTPSTLTGTNATTSLQGLVQSKHGWVTKLLYPTETPPVPPRERVLDKPTVVGGIVFFPSFVPDSDLCKSLGTGYLYALFYQTGTAYNQDVIGTDAVGGKTQVKSNISLGDGQTGQLGVHIGAQGTDASGTGSGEGCQGSVSIIGQSSTGMISKNCVRTQAVWSRFLSWNNMKM